VLTLLDPLHEAREKFTSGGGGVWGSERAMQATSKPGHKVLYKTIDMARHMGLVVDGDGTLSSDNLCLSWITAGNLSDFSGCGTGESRLLYFAEDAEIAELQARYMRRRGTGRETILVLVLCVPISGIEALLAEEENGIRHLNWPSDEWKKLVWYSHAWTEGYMCDGEYVPPEEILNWWEDSGTVLMIGSMGRLPGDAYRTLKRWEDIGDDEEDKYVSKIRGEIARQFVFNGDDGFDWFKENGGKDMKAFVYEEYYLA